MRIDVRDAEGKRLGRVEVDPAQRPSLVRLTLDAKAGPDAKGAPGLSAPPATGPAEPHEHFLNWDEALDDAGQLRRCVVCGCSSLYRSKVLPQVTPFVVVLAFAGAVIGFLGYSRNPVVLPALVVLLVVDVGTLGLAGTRLVCYRCRSVYSRCAIARYHRRWDRSEAERVRAAADAVAAGSDS